MVQPTKYIWMDGELVSWDQAQVHVLSYTMHYGLGAFEGIRAYKTGPDSGAVFRLSDHSERFAYFSHQLEHISGLPAQK